jgi:SSS family solute:Na+ symporter
MSRGLSLLDYGIVGVYLVGMVALGALLVSRIKGFKDFFLGGGALTTPLLVCTLVSSYYGLEVTFGTSETGFYYGLAAWFWFSFPYYIFIALTALVVAPRLRAGPFMSLPDLLGQHYGNSARVAGAAASFVYSAPIVQMASLMTLIQWLGMPLYWSMLVTVAVCAVYTMLGGLWADAISDTVQFVLMCVSLAILIPLAVQWVGGWEFANHLPVNGQTGSRDHMTLHGGASYGMLAAWAVAGMTVLVEPVFYQRVFAARDQRSITRALLIGILLWASYDWCVVLIGIIARAAVEANMAGIPHNLEGKQSLVAVGLLLLPSGLRGLLLGGILSAAMSTIDSYSLVASSNVVYDVYRPLFHPRASDRRLVLLTRAGVLVVMVSATVGSLAFQRLRDAWQFMASVLTSVVLVPVLGALLGRPRRAAGTAGSISGLVGLMAFYVILITLGEYDVNEQAYVLRLGDVEIWQDCAALCAIPVSLMGYTIGNWVGRK